jgi:hypothetical protein
MDPRVPYVAAYAIVEPQRTAEPWSPGTGTEPDKFVFPTTLPNYDPRVTELTVMQAALIQAIKDLTEKVEELIKIQKPKKKGKKS